MKLRNRDQFTDRVEAGRVLAGLLRAYVGREDVVVLGLPRGGVPVAAVVAGVLGAQLDVLIVRKLGAPGQPELAMGAIAAVGADVEVVHNESVQTGLRISPATFGEVYRRELDELRRRAITYRGQRPPVAIGGKAVIVVDDGLATGSTMRAAVAAVRQSRPATLVVAVPVGAVRTCESLRSEVDEVVCALYPNPFHAVHQGYRDFSQTRDEEVLALLRHVGT